MQTVQDITNEMQVSNGAVERCSLELFNPVWCRCAMAVALALAGCMLRVRGCFVS